MESMEENRSSPAPQAAPLRIRPIPMATYIIIGMNVAYFAVMVASGVSALHPDIEDLVRWGADFGPHTMGGEPWRLVTAMFMHIGLLHIAVNMYALWNCGPLAESLFGRKNYLILYLLSGLAGNVVSLSWNPYIVSAGASGALFGIIGALLGFAIRHKKSLNPEFFSGFVKSILSTIAINVFLGLSVPGIDNACHLGGLASGFVAGVILAPAPRSDRKWGILQYVGVAIIVMLIVAGGVFARQRIISTIGEPVSNY